MAGMRAIGADLYQSRVHGNSNFPAGTIFANGYSNRRFSVRRSYGKEENMNMKNYRGTAVALFAAFAFMSCGQAVDRSVGTVIFDPGTLALSTRNAVPLEYDERDNPVYYKVTGTVTITGDYQAEKDIVFYVRSRFRENGQETYYDFSPVPVIFLLPPGARIDIAVKFFSLNVRGDFYQNICQGIATGIVVYPGKNRVVIPMSYVDDVKDGK